MPESPPSEPSLPTTTAQQPPGRRDEQNLYSHVMTLVGFGDSVNCLQFDQEAALLAVGCDDGRFRAFQVGGNYSQVVKFRIPDVAVTSLLWHPTKVGVVYIGYSDGGIVECRIDRTAPQGVAGFNPVPLGLRGPVEALDYSSHTSNIAAIVGHHAVLAEWVDLDGLWASRIMPLPPSHNVIPNNEGILPRSLHFCKQGRALVVSYIYHGIVGWDVSSGTCLWRILPGTRIARSALSPDERTIVICNLLDGFAQYDIETRKQVRRYTQEVVENVSLPVLFIQDGHSILCGSDHGEVAIFDQCTGTLLQVLQHPDHEIVQAIAHRQARNVDWIATGTSEKGQDTAVLIWRRTGSAHTRGTGHSGSTCSISSPEVNSLSAGASSAQDPSLVRSTGSAVSAGIPPPTSHPTQDISRVLPDTNRQRHTTSSVSARGDAAEPSRNGIRRNSQRNWTTAFVLAPVVLALLAVCACNGSWYWTDSSGNSLQLRSASLGRFVLKVAAIFAQYFPGITDFLKEFANVVEALARDG